MAMLYTGRVSVVRGSAGSLKQGSRAVVAPGPQLGETADERQARLASTAWHVAQQDPSVRLAKVLALQQAIAGGSYRVSASEIAEKMMRKLSRSQDQSAS